MSEEVVDNAAGWVGDHVRRYVESGGRRGHRFNGHAALLITTRGRRTGRLRRTALYYERDGSRYILVATAVHGGEDPAWYLNVLDNPAVTRLVPRYLSYETEAGRELPIVVADQSLNA